MILNFNEEQKHHSLDNRPITVIFHVLLYRRSSILQGIYFLYCIRRFVSELIEYTPGAYSIYTVWLTANCLLDISPVMIWWLDTNPSKFDLGLNF